MDRSIGGKLSGGLSGLTIIMVVVAASIGGPVYVQALPCISTVLPCAPTELDANLLNLDGSNIDVNLLLTVCYTDYDGNPQCEDSITGFPPVWTWSIYAGKSNFYGLVPALDGTNITLTVDGYESANVTAVESRLVAVTLYVPRINTRTAEFDTVMARAVAKNNIYGQHQKANILYTALKVFNETTPLVVDVRSYPEYAMGHIPGAINIYYRDLGKDSTLAYLDLAYNNHIAAGGKDEIVVYGNTRHLSMLVLAYLRELGKPCSSKTYQLSDGFAAWTQNETVAPGRFKECTSFDPVTGKGTAPAGCTSNNFTITLDNPINNTDGTHGGQGYAEVNTGGSTRYEIIQRTWDSRFGDMSRPDYTMTAAELHDLLDDNQDGIIQGPGDDLSNDPYI